MKRLTAIAGVLLTALVLPAGALATQPATTSSATPPAQGQASGAVIAVARGSFAIEAPAGRMSVVNALTAAANTVTAGDFPYVYGGGHAEAGIASIGIKGPGYNGRRIGFDCSGSVAAVLAGAGVWQPTSGVPNDAGIITELLQQHLIARGAAHGATEVTLYDYPGVHIFMDIDWHLRTGRRGRRRSAGWRRLARRRRARRDKPRLQALPPAARSDREQTTFERILTFQTGANASVTHGLELGSDVHVGYTQAPNCRMTAVAVS